jgi:D-glycero-D-manno-heptose 1,7-bisphosphate phosphatase
MSGEEPPAACWSRIGPEVGRVRGRPALFLDRDGVVVVETGYLGDPSQVELIPGAGEAIARARSSRLAVVLVTNQSGVGRGYYGWTAFESVQAEIARRLAAEAPDARFDAEFACGVAPGAGGPDHPWRKPAPGMLLAAAEALGVDLAASWIVGDRVRDLAAGRAAGLAGGVLVATGQCSPAEQAAAQALRSGAFEVMLAADLRAAVADLQARGWAPGKAGAPSPC